MAVASYGVVEMSGHWYAACTPSRAHPLRWQHVTGWLGRTRPALHCFPHPCIDSQRFFDSTYSCLHNSPLRLLSRSASVSLGRGATCALVEVEAMGDDFPPGDVLGFWVVLKVANRSFLSLYAAYI